MDSRCSFRKTDGGNDLPVGSQNQSEYVVVSWLRKLGTTATITIAYSPLEYRLRNYRANQTDRKLNQRRQASYGLPSALGYSAM